MKTYYEVQTCAGIDPPQQTRAFEILWDGGEHVALVTAMVDFEETGGLADEGRLLAFNDPLSRSGQARPKTGIRCACSVFLKSFKKTYARQA